MKTYIAFLGGINVGGHKKILMKDLKKLLDSIGLKEITTYIQSGNVVFKASEATNLASKIAEAIELKYSFSVPVLVKKATELNKIVSKCPFFDEKREKSYFILLDKNPTKEQIKLIAGFSTQNEEFYITPNCVYIYYANGAGKAKMGINFFERKLNVKATARNHRTMKKLLELAAS